MAKKLFSQTRNLCIATRKENFMKKNQMMLTCSGVMLVLQSIAFYIVWSSGYSETMLRRMFLIELLTLAYLLLTARRTNSNTDESMVGFCIAYVAALFMFFPVLGILLFLQFEFALIELLIIILAIVVAVIDKKKE